MVGDEEEIEDEIFDEIVEEDGEEISSDSALLDPDESERELVQGSVARAARRLRSTWTRTPRETM